MSEGASCVRCNDTGLIEYTGGTHRSYGNTYEGGREIEATPENPVYRFCSCKHADRVRIVEPPKTAAVYE